MKLLISLICLSSLSVMAQTMNNTKDVFSDSSYGDSEKATQTPIPNPPAWPSPTELPNTQQQRMEDRTEDRVNSWQAGSKRAIDGRGE